MRFYLGTPCPHWLEDLRFEGVPLFVSRNRLAGHTAQLRARTRWCLDSGAFTQIASHGRFTISPRRYAEEARRFQREIGRMDAAAIQDWMCEPEMLKKTGKSVVEHQILTTRSLLELRDLAPDVPWMPILQGFEAEDYMRHTDRYERAGIDLLREPIVGIGSCCRRQDTEEISGVVRALFRIGIRLHAFGLKTLGVRDSGKYLHSSDSMAWSYAARFRPVRLPECTHGYPTCEYCETWALRWRRQLLQVLGRVL